jgi:hypothetical protein
VNVHYALLGTLAVAATIAELAGSQSPHGSGTISTGDLEWGGDLSPERHRFPEEVSVS